jgi:hypothetical protein
VVAYFRENKHLALDYGNGMELAILSAVTTSVALLSSTCGTKTFTGKSFVISGFRKY